ncbi:MAG: G/U mismatch-specific DNA glycosylase [Massilia sp.]
MSESAAEQGLPDIFAPGLQVVFCGLNPGVDAAAAGHHFLGRGNRFWPVLHLAGFTPYLVAPQDDKSVLAWGIGLMAAVARPTRRADQVGGAEYASAAPALLAKLALHQPRYIAFLGKAAYQNIVGKREVAWGEQSDCLAGTRVWVLPNPSGLNRGFSLAQLVHAYAELRRAAQP